MSSKNISTIDIPPGIWREDSAFATGPRWFNGNLVRWLNRTAMPIGGWVKVLELPAAVSPPGPPFRTTFSWKDNLAKPWFVLGSAGDCQIVKVGDPYVVYDATPATLAWNPGGMQGFGRGNFGSGAFGRSLHLDIALDQDALWSFDNFGRDLVAVHSQDGRLFTWSPTTPTADLAQVAGAPIDNRLVIVTDERFVMVFGGKNNPRKIKWSSRENMTDWVPIATNSAGGYDLHSSGEILAVAKFPGGILVWTDVDVHLMTFIGAPYWYSEPQRITDITGILGTNAWAHTPNGVVWIGNYAIWNYNGTVNKLHSTLSGEIFGNSNLQRKQVMFVGINEQMSEVWFFYPDKSASEPNRMILGSYAKGEPFWWTLGGLPRTAWLNPCWQSRPLGIQGRIVYEHESGWTDAGLARDIWLESGDFSAGDADRVIKVNRVTPDQLDVPTAAGPPATPSVHPFRLKFSLRDQPEREYREYGPVTFDNARKYTPVRFRTRLMKIKVEEVVASGWGMGKLLLRIGEGGRRG